MNSTVLPELSNIFPAGISFIEVLSFIGILITIAISYSSLNQQRMAAARESLEQLDDLHIKRRSAKIKTILHKYSNWPFKKSVVKLQASKTTDIAGVSRPHHLKFLALPGYVFQGFEVDPVNDGYHLTIHSSDPVEIRKTTNELLYEINKETQRSDGFAWVTSDEYVDVFRDSMNGELGTIHELVIEYLEEGPKSAAEIRDYVGDNGFQNHLGNLAIRDLLHFGEIELNDDSDYVLPN